MRIQIFFALLCALFCGSTALAFDLPALFLGGGVMSYSTGRLANTITGASTSNAVVLSQFSLGADFGLPSPVPDGSIMVQATYTPFGKISVDKGVKTTMLGVSGRYKHRFYFLDAKTGPGLFMYRVAGSGGELELDNGTTKSYFALPANSYSSWTGYWDVGIGGGWRWIRVDLDAWVHDFFSSQRRSVSLLASVSIFFL
ncbi:hypothetical protein WDW86_16895 [Bdellovibrionota bacterium FG-2]